MTTLADAAIESLTTWRVVVPLPEPLRVWGKAITSREFVFVRAQSGKHVGTGFALTRGMPVGVVIEQQLKPQVVGRPASAVRAIWQGVRDGARMTGDTGILARALSVVDIALWDLLGQVLGVPLWRLWGGAAGSVAAGGAAAGRANSSVPCAAICGYYKLEDSVGSVRREAERLVKAGYTRFKMPFGEDLDLDVQRIHALREVVGPRALIGIDASGTFNNLKEALNAWHRVERYGIDFLEDPFPAGQWELAIQLAERGPMKVAFGESITSPQGIQALSRAGVLEVLRPDATVLHGITGFLQGIAPALENRLNIFPHYYPDIHAPLVGALGLMMTEESPEEAETVGFDVLRATQPVIKDGHWQLTERPGLGIDWDEAALRHYAM